MDLTIIRNADIYAPEHLGIKDVLIGGGRILSVDGRIDSIRGAREIDAEGEILEPGLVDGHVHIIGGGGEDGMLSRVPPLREEKIVKAGVTSLVGLLGTDGYTRTVRDLVAKSKAINEYGIFCRCLTGSYQLPSPTITGDVGDDIIYIDEVIGVKVAVSDHRCSLPTTEELLRLATTVRLASLMSRKAGVVHIHVGADRKGIEQLFEIAETTPLPIKHFYPTHMEGHPEQCEKWLEMGGHIDLTCKRNLGLLIERLLEINPENLTLSTDSNGSFPIWNERKEIVGMGAGDILNLRSTIDNLIYNEKMDRTKVLSLCTRNAAKANRFEGRGEIREGNYADLVLRDGRNLRHVIANGVFMMTDGNVKRSMYENSFAI